MTTLEFEQSSNALNEDILRTVKYLSTASKTHIQAKLQVAVFNM
jgi:hypothetical protein